MNNRRIYCDVDTQHDFMSPTGALSVPDALSILPNVEALVQRAAFDPTCLLVGSVDTHDYRCREFIENGGPFPAHCVKGTLGWCKVLGTFPERSIIRPKMNRAYQGMLIEGCQGYYFEKADYSIFDNAGIDGLTDAWFLQNKIRETPQVDVFVFGVATDFCVKEAALGFKRRGFRTFIVGDAIAAVTEDGGARALDEMFQNGIDTVFTKDVI